MVILLLAAACPVVGALYADSGSKFAVQPVKVVRLLNSVYGSEHLLLFGREDECLSTPRKPPTHSLHTRSAPGHRRYPSPLRPDQLMSTLLAFDQATALEAEVASPGIFSDLGLAGKLLARADFFEAVARQSYGPWELAQRARRAEGVADAMVQHLAERRSAVESSTCLGATAVALRYVARHRAIAGVAVPRPLSMAGRHLPGAPACLVPWPSGVE